MDSPFILVNHASPIPPYEQIRLQLRTLIVSGQLKPGDRLPAVRQLADDLSIAPNTVVRSYEELAREGWIVTADRRRAVVADRADALADEERRSRLTEAVQQFLLSVHQLDVRAEELHAEIDRQLRENTDQPARSPRNERVGW